MWRGARRAVLDRKVGGCRQSSPMRTPFRWLTSSSLASADPTPEDFDGGPHEKGPRTVTLCPAFFRDNQTRRRLPGDDEAKKAEFCKDRQSKTLSDFQTGGMHFASMVCSVLLTYICPAHTLLLEISRLDTFGVAAEYPEAAQAATNDVPEHTHHGAVDWRGKADAGNARALKTSKDQGKPATWQNAGSLAAAATGEQFRDHIQAPHADAITEMYAMAACGLKDIDVSTGQQSAALKFGPTCDSLLWGFSILLFWLCGS